ncbi:ABC-2 transporter permease [Staphylococcus arlettae]|uniref:ABC-2 transporter permease n=1 Tax=Staphylococcus arlettae TaxID=29378 RepID=UPI0021D2EF9A|nr:ABC-2 transporter permease [Staphylococcus arlettae]UXU51191.1 ABC-2 transporter permease [Staphylococcus arlettae]
MNGLLKSHYYANQEKIIVYTILGSIISVFLSFINPLMSIFAIMVLLTTVATDNLKSEKISKWINYISTLPITRSTYIISHFTFYILLSLLGMLISTIILIIVTKSFLIILTSLFIGIGITFQYSLIFPLTFKFGVEKSNAIFLTTSFFVISLYVPFFYGLLRFGNGSYVDILENISANLLYSSLYALLGFVILVVSVFMSIKIFKFKEL